MGTTYQSVTIDAPAENVWSTVRNFHDFSWAPNVITKCSPVGDLSGDQVGARRILNDAFHETLLELSDITRTIRYSIDEGPPPVSKDDVSGYTGILRILPVTDTNTSFVEWSSSWDGNDAATYEFCHGIYCSLLEELKKHFS